MKKLRFYIDEVEGMDNNFLAWHCTDGIATYFGETKIEAASQFGCALGEFDDEADRAALGTYNRYERL